MRILITLFSGISALCAQHAGPATNADPDAVWNDLMAGNKRYVSGTLSHPHQSPARRDEVAKAQKPTAVVLSCADSRVPPEAVFDQGIGDVFTVRVAGNVATDDIIASIEYAVAHLGPKLIVVLGHERCGAVDAALKGGPPEGHLGVLLGRIKPATDSVKGQTGDVLDLAVRANVRNVVNQLKSSTPILAGKVKSGDVKIVGARYDLDSGKVEVLY